MTKQTWTATGPVSPVIDARRVRRCSAKVTAAAASADTVWRDEAEAGQGQGSNNTNRDERWIEARFAAEAIFFKAERRLVASKKGGCVDVLVSTLMVCTCCSCEIGIIAIWCAPS